MTNTFASRATGRFARYCLRPIKLCQANLRKINVAEFGGDEDTNLRKDLATVLL